MIDLEAIRILLGAEWDRATRVLLPVSKAPVDVPTMRRTYSPWRGDLGRFASPSVPGKTVYDHEGEAQWAEVIIRKLLHDHGWEAVWVKNFGGGRKFWTDMDVELTLDPRARQVLRSIDSSIEELMGWPKGSEAGRLRRGGVWDAFAVKDDDVLFIEDKFAPGLNLNQKLFLEAALLLDRPPGFLVLNRVEVPQAGA